MVGGDDFYQLIQNLGITCASDRPISEITVAKTYLVEGAFVTQVGGHAPLADLALVVWIVGCVPVNLLSVSLVVTNLPQSIFSSSFRFLKIFSEVSLDAKGSFDATMIVRFRTDEYNIKENRFFLKLNTIYSALLPHKGRA